MQTLPAHARKYRSYDVDVSAKEDYKSTEIMLCSFTRPHMRAFHSAWWAFFIAFLVWFSIVPILPEIKKDLNLANNDIWTSTVASFAGTFFIRLFLGPLCDQYGPRILFSLVLCFSAIPAACTGLLETVNGLIALRLFTGFAGGSFVMCQFWMSNMFAKEIVGSASSLVAGWGNLGGGMTHLVLGTFLFPFFEYLYGHQQEDDDKSDRAPSEAAWRTVCVIPAVVAFCTGVWIFCYTDDCPKGNYSALRKFGSTEYPSAAKSLRSACFDANTWILFIQYGACFGVELTMNNAAALYFREKFGLSLESSSAVAAIFGWMNLCARGMGGAASDAAMSSLGMRGRLFIQMWLLIVEGCLVLAFRRTQTLSAAIMVLVLFSFAVQASEGSTYGIVPYVKPLTTGSVAGIVGAGGTAGAIIFTLALREWNYESAFDLMGGGAILAGLLTVFIHLRYHACILCGEDLPHDANTGSLILPTDDDFVRKDLEVDLAIGV